MEGTSIGLRNSRHCQELVSLSLRVYIDNPKILILGTAANPSNAYIPCNALSRTKGWTTVDWKGAQSLSERGSEIIAGKLLMLLDGETNN